MLKEEKITLDPCVQQNPLPLRSAKPGVSAGAETMTVS